MIKIANGLSRFQGAFVHSVLPEFDCLRVFIANFKVGMTLGLRYVWLCKWSHVNKGIFTIIVVTFCGRGVFDI